MEGDRMARYLGSRCKKCRALGFSVCGSDRCALLRRSNPPGMHPDLRRRMSDHKKRLIEKQRLRFSYWVSEKQFRNYVEKVLRKPGIPGETLLSLLERRLDNNVYRLGFAPTLLAARQLVVHGHVLVNGRKVDRPSYALRPGEVVSIREKSKKMLIVEEGLARSPARLVLPYLEVDRKNLQGKLTSIPERAQIPLEINEGLIMEHYTRYI
jgi:small subunit ribosomal protein S4